MIGRSITLAILCGGQARRLGTDKGLFAPLGDESLVARALRLWADSVTHTLVVVRDDDQARLYRAALAQHPLILSGHVSIVADYDTPGDPPRAALAGVSTALRWNADHHRQGAEDAAVIAVPVDQVGVRTLHLQRLSRAWEQAGYRAAPVCFQGPDDMELAFPSLWPQATHGRLETLIDAGALSVKGALAELQAQVVPAEDAATALQANINTPSEARAYFGAPLHDPFGRRLHYLRFSLTEACNLSCTYCLPEGYPEWHRHKARLDTREIEVILRGFRQLGFRKLRLTGGEPTVHPRCLDTVRLARDLGYEQIAMTTNGLLIKDLSAWIAAGLNQLNVSLDSLDSEKFYAVTRSRAAHQVRDLIEAAASYAPALTVKINTVLLRTKNGDRQNIEELIDWALGLPVTLRFIELMDTKLNSSFALSERVLGSEIEPLLTARGLSRWQAATHVSPGALDLRGPATDYGAPQHRGQIGLINPLSCNFCSKCNRLRITAKGRLKLCLFGDDDLPLDLTTPEAVALNVRQLIAKKPERHYLEQGQVGNVSTFRTIGG